MNLVKGKGEDARAQIVNQANTSLTPDLAQRLCDAATECPSISRCAAQCGVPYQVIRNWLRLGFDGDPRYSLFAVEFERCRSGHEDRWMGHIEAIAEDDDPKVANARLRATEFLLKKHFPKQYGDQVFVSTMIERQADGFKLDALPADALREFQKMLKALKADNDGADPSEVQRLVSKIKVDAKRKDDDGAERKAD